MDEPQTTRLVETVLRCYPARWRQRHGDEAADPADVGGAGGRWLRRPP